ncbi:MAG: GtrA family protein [Acidimicrobiales bacterium]
MVDRLSRLWSWLHTREGRKIFRYTMTSVITTVISLVMLALVFGVFHLWGEITSTVFANVCAAVPSYYLNRQWAWGKRGRSHVFKEVLPFWILAGASISFSIVGAASAKWVGEQWGANHFEQTVLVLAANVLCFGIFWILKLLTFNRTFRVPTLLEEIDEHLEAEQAGAASAVSPHGDDPTRAAVR